MEGKRGFEYSSPLLRTMTGLCCSARSHRPCKELDAHHSSEVSYGQTPVFSGFYQAFVTKAPVISREAWTNQVIAGTRHRTGETWETTTKIDDLSA